MSNLEVTSISGDAVVNITASAWVNFNGTGTVAIRKAYNVSSITDNAVGDYTVNFTTAMPDADYAIGGAAGNVTTNQMNVGNNGASHPPTTTACRVQVTYQDATVYDTPYISLIFMGGQ